MGPSGAAFYATYDSLASAHQKRQKRRRNLNGESSDVCNYETSAASIYVNHAHPSSCMDMGVLHTLIYSGVSGVVAEWLVYPLEMIRRQMQVQSVSAGLVISVQDNAMKRTITFMKSFAMKVNYMENDVDMYPLRITTTSYYNLNSAFRHTCLFDFPK